MKSPLELTCIKSLSGLVRSGLVQEVIEAHGNSRVKDPEAIMHILHDHLSVGPVLLFTTSLTHSQWCRHIHSSRRSLKI